MDTEVIIIILLGVIIYLLIQNSQKDKSQADRNSYRTERKPVVTEEEYNRAVTKWMDIEMAMYPPMYPGGGWMPPPIDVLPTYEEVKYNRRRFESILIAIGEIELEDNENDDLYDDED